MPALAEGAVHKMSKYYSCKLNIILSKTVGSQSVCLIGIAGLQRQLGCMDSLPPVFMDFRKGVFVTREN